MLQQSAVQHQQAGKASLFNAQQLQQQQQQHPDQKSVAPSVAHAAQSSSTAVYGSVPHQTQQQEGQQDPLVHAHSNPATYALLPGSFPPSFLGEGSSSISREVIRQPADQGQTRNQAEHGFSSQKGQGIHPQVCSLRVSTEQPPMSDPSTLTSQPALQFFREQEPADPMSALHSDPQSQRLAQPQTSTMAPSRAIHALPHFQPSSHICVGLVQPQQWQQQQQQQQLQQRFEIQGMPNQESTPQLQGVQEPEPGAQHSGMHHFQSMNSEVHSIPQSQQWQQQQQQQQQLQGVGSLDNMTEQQPVHPLPPCNTTKSQRHFYSPDSPLSSAYPPLQPHLVSSSAVPNQKAGPPSETRNNSSGDPVSAQRLHHSAPTIEHPHADVIICSQHPPVIASTSAAPEGSPFLTNYEQTCPGHHLPTFDSPTVNRHNPEGRPASQGDFTLPGELEDSPTANWEPGARSYPVKGTMQSHWSSSSVAESTQGCRLPSLPQNMTQVRVRLCIVGRFLVQRGIDLKQ